MNNIQFVILAAIIFGGSWIGLSHVRSQLVASYEKQEEAEIMEMAAKAKELEVAEAMEIAAKEEPEPTGPPIFTGGTSPIESNDPKRATKAAARVTPMLKEELAKLDLKLGSPIFLRIFKETNELEVWVKGSPGKFSLFRTYQIAFYSGKLGPKTKEGDQQAPEGFYWVPKKALNPYSKYHLALNIGYPNSYDKAHKRTGSLIMIHGKDVSIGCFAMTDVNIEEIYTLASAALNKGQRYFRVHCFPFRMTSERMAQAQESEWYAFWKNLREGYLAFENERIPPDTNVEDKHYVFTDG